VTEAEWLACDDPEPMLKFVVGKVSERKVLLFCVAACALIRHFLDSGYLHLLSLTERFADGDSTFEELSAAYQLLPEGPLGQKVPADSAVWWAPLGLANNSRGGARLMADSALGVVVCVTASLGSGNRPGRQPRSRVVRGRVAEGNRRLASLLRDVAAVRPLPAPTVEPWRTPTATALAQAAYKERALPLGQIDPSRLAVLADALEEAGCTDPDLLGHLRAPGPHVRGCWALDLVLGRE
jgi:hypothetical protein